MDVDVDNADDGSTCEKIEKERAGQCQKAAQTMRGPKENLTKGRAGQRQKPSQTMRLKHHLQHEFRQRKGLGIVTNQFRQ
jgi:hypothetical protein